MPLSNNTKTGAEIISKHSNIFRYGKGSGEGKGVKFSLEKKSSQLCKLQIHIFYSDLIHNFFFFLVSQERKSWVFPAYLPNSYITQTTSRQSMGWLLLICMCSWISICTGFCRDLCPYNKCERVKYVNASVSINECVCVWERERKRIWIFVREERGRRGKGERHLV